MGTAHGRRVLCSSGSACVLYDAELNFRTTKYLKTGPFAAPTTYISYLLMTAPILVGLWSDQVSPGIVYAGGYLHPTDQQSTGCCLFPRHRLSTIYRRSPVAQVRSIYLRVFTSRSMIQQQKGQHNSEGIYAVEQQPLRNSIVLPKCTRKKESV